MTAIVWGGWDEKVRDDPFPTFAAARGRGTVQQVRLPDGHDAWVVLGYDIGTVIWATGFRPDHSWLDVPVLDRAGRLRHDGGVVTDASGLYVLGLPLLRTRASTYFYGATADTAALADRMLNDLVGRGPRGSVGTGSMGNEPGASPTSVRG